MHIISSNIEHHSITSAIKQKMLINEDIEYTFVKSDKAGLINPIDIADSIKLHTKLCSIMLVNNELGTVQPTSIIGEICKENNVLFHTDAVQAYGHMPIHVKKQNIDLMSTSAHKLHGPKGIGFLYISNDCKQQYLPLINGGQQERGMRASTENVAAIVGFAKAVAISLDRMESITKAETNIFNLLLARLKKIPGISLNGDENLIDKRHINICISGVRAEELMALLNVQDIYISTGSACNSKSNKPSHVLRAIGLTDEAANSSIRISFDHTLHMSEIDYFINCLKTDINMLRASNE
jgi:cysteine desulfurase